MVKGTKRKNVASNDISIEEFHDAQPSMPKKRGSRKGVKKPRDKNRPPRPLSAYNYFFAEAREHLHKVIVDKDHSVNVPGSLHYLDPTLHAQMTSPKGNISFQHMAAYIGDKWKQVSPEQKELYQKMADEDTKRYEKDMALYTHLKSTGQVVTKASYTEENRAKIHVPVTGTVVKTEEDTAASEAHLRAAELRLKSAEMYMKLGDEEEAKKQMEQYKIEMDKSTNTVNI